MAAGRVAMAVPMMPVRVQVRALASSGAGVADLPDGRVAFIHGTVPGDEADVRVEHRKDRWATARLVELRQPGPHRVAPPCSLFGSCGGCTLQHLAYPEQLRWKARFVADALARIGRLEGVDPPPVEASPREWHYRNRLTFTLKRLRGGRVVAGFHELGRPARVLDVGAQCRLGAEVLHETWLRLRSGWGPGARRLPEGGELRLGLRTRPDGVELYVEGGQGDWDAAELASEVGGLCAVWHRASGEEVPRLMAGEAGPRGPGAFEQVNDAVAEALRGAVLEAAGDARVVVDAYCGAGAYGRALAEAGATVRGIEVDGEAVRAAELDAPEGFDVTRGTVEGALEESLPADLVIVNPPRTGLHADVPEVLVRCGPERVVYVSCDPATLARDLARLARRYRLERLSCFDLFPQTAHVETLAVLERVEDVR